MNLNDQSPIKGKTWGRCSKNEMLKIIEGLVYENKVYKISFQRLRLKTAWLPDE